MLPRETFLPRVGGRAAVFAMAITLIAAACTSGADDGNSLASANGARPSGAADQILWGECMEPVRGGIECGTLDVPLDWDEPEGQQIELAVARERASGERKGTVITNPGGPGGSGLQFLGYHPFSGDITESFDIVSWDPRGVGESTSMQCGNAVPEFLAQDPSPDSASETSDLEDAASAVADECAEVDSELIDHLNTALVAQDLEALRVALGNEPLNYVGFSYGTHIGQLYAEMYGNNVRTMVLDGVVDPALTFEEFLIDQTRAFDTAFNDFADACAEAGSACAVDNLAAAYDEVSEQLEASPLEVDGREIGQAELGTAAARAAYANDGWKALSRALSDAAEGDGERIWELASSYYDFGSYGAYAGVVCTDSPHPEGYEEYSEFVDRSIEASERFGPTIANEMLPCATWGAETLSAPEPIEAGDTASVLVIGNTGDPATPLHNAQSVAGTLANGHLITVDIDGHTAYGLEACTTEIVDNYLLSATLDNASYSC